MLTASPSIVTSTHKITAEQYDNHTHSTIIYDGDDDDDDDDDSIDDNNDGKDDLDDSP